MISYMEYNLGILYLWVWFREEIAGNYERAATIAVFQGRIRRGIASLKDGAGVAQQHGDATKGRAGEVT